MEDIKRYCKNFDILDLKFIENCCLEYLDGKWNRKDVRQTFAEYMNISKDEVLNKTKEDMIGVVPVIALDLRNRILKNNLNLKPIRYFEKIDGMSGKLRVLGIEEPIHQMLNYVCVGAMKPMLKAKIGEFQCSSIPKRGQSYGKKHLDKWKHSIRYFAKGDITKCFPSIPLDKLKALLRRDIKNTKIINLAESLLDMFKQGLSIGSYLSQYLCNYYLSYAYHFACEKLYKIRKTKKQGEKRVRLINHVLFYMDDFLLTGTSKKDLRKAMKMLISYIADFLGLVVKNDWKINKFSDEEPIDMMGFVFRPNKTTIRAKIFIKTRRQFLRAWKEFKTNSCISVKRARMVISAFGWYKHTDSCQVREKLKIDKIVAIAKKTISNYDKGVDTNEVLQYAENEECLLLQFA